MVFEEGVRRRRLGSRLQGAVYTGRAAAYPRRMPNLGAGELLLLLLIAALVFAFIAGAVFIGVRSANRATQRRSRSD